MVAIERQQEVICALSNDDIFIDIDGPLTRFSRSRIFEVKYFKILSYGQNYYKTRIGNYNQSIEWYHFQ